MISGEGNLFVLPKLPYAYNALEPFIDRRTMEIHHTKHHQAYVDKLNAALKDAPANTIDFNVSDAAKCGKITPGTPDAIRNNLGGHYNHSLFWTLMKPNPKALPNLPKGKLNEAILKKFGTFDHFKRAFSDKATRLFGSGWCWLAVIGTEIIITTSENQDNPLMQIQERGTPVLALDVWEHAYYLKYQNKRADYITGWWNIINWDKAEALFNAPPEDRR
ncbi:superoxide dismutase [Sphingobacteriaceae bacterium]|nr:superoxide dismutase [Sphingobacteriaceae bacterium]